MILNDYDKIIKEHFNLFDSPTRRMIVSLTEDGEQTQMLNALSNALYKKVTSDIGKIDFGSIPRSRGDITKVEKFDETEECLIIMRKLVQEYRQNPEVVDNVILAVKNIKDRKALFAKGFATNNNFIITLYNLMVLAIEQSVSFLISVCIQYIKDPDTKNMNIALDKVAYYNTRENVLYEQIVSFNEACANGSVDKVLNGVTVTGKAMKESYEDIALVARVDGEPDREIDMPQPENPNPVEPNPKDIPDPDASVVQEEEPENDYSYELDQTAGDGTISSDVPINDKAQATNEVATIGTIVFAISTAVFVSKLFITVFIPKIRDLVYFFIHAGMKFADTLEVQANLIELNAYNLQTTTEEEDGFDPKKREQIVKKQLKVVATLKKWSNKIAIIFNKSDKDTKANRVKFENEKYNAKDLKDDLPVDIYNKSVLF